MKASPLSHCPALPARPTICRYRDLGTLAIPCASRMLNTLRMIVFSDTAAILHPMVAKLDG
eukprot:scaffold132578_cov37-Prasinocladus_malaysianus.AAC.2